MGVKDGYEPLHLPGQRYPAHGSPFGQPSDESTLTWGDTQQIIVGAGEASSGSVQLVHVMRKRPTTYTVAVQLTLGAGWPGPPGNVDLIVENIIGVGQARCTLVRTFTVLAADVVAGASVVNEVYTVPATALQCRASIAPVNALLAPADAALTILVAPVFE